MHFPLNTDFVVCFPHPPPTPLYLVDKVVWVSYSAWCWWWWLSPSQSVSLLWWVIEFLFSGHVKAGYQCYWCSVQFKVWLLDGRNYNIAQFYSYLSRNIRRTYKDKHESWNQTHLGLFLVSLLTILVLYYGKKKKKIPNVCGLMLRKCYTAVHHEWFKDLGPCQLIVITPCKTSQSSSCSWWTG